MRSILHSQNHVNSNISIISCILSYTILSLISNLSFFLRRFDFTRYRFHEKSKLHEVMFVNSRVVYRVGIFWSVLVIISW